MNLSCSASAQNQNLEAAAGGLATQSWQYLVLVQTDNAWMAHLKSMKLLQQSIGLRSYQNLDVKEEYGREAKILFEGLVDNVRRDTGKPFASLSYRKVVCCSYLFLLVQFFRTFGMKVELVDILTMVQLQFLHYPTQ